MKQSRFSQGSYELKVQRLCKGKNLIKPQCQNLTKPNTSESKKRYVIMRRLWGKNKDKLKGDRAILQTLQTLKEKESEYKYIYKYLYK